MRFIFLSQCFFDDYPAARYPEIERKENRPYTLVEVQVEGTRWGLPLRSHINHEYCFWTDRQNRCGIDYSKAVLLKPQYIDENRKPYLRPQEFDYLKGKDHLVVQGFIRYIKQYRRARQQHGQPHNARICRYSTLQYFLDV
jgi:protein AbiQ